MEFKLSSFRGIFEIWHQNYSGCINKIFVLNFRIPFSSNIYLKLSNSTIYYLQWGENSNKIAEMLLMTLNCWLILRVTYSPSCCPNWLEKFPMKIFSQIFSVLKYFLCLSAPECRGSHWDRKINKWLSNLRTCRNLKRKKSVCFQEFELISRCRVWNSYWLSGEITN